MKKNTLLSAAALLSFPFVLSGQGNYRVQLTGMETPVALDYFADMDNVQTAKDQNDIYLYYIGDFGTLEEAEATLNAAKAKGYTYATVLDMQARKEACACTNSTEGIYIRHLFFDFDKDFLRSASKRELQKLAKILRNNPSYRAQLIGHTDSKGSNEYNIDLSKRRSNNAERYLETLGVTNDRVDIVFRGELEPIAKNDDNGKDRPDGRQFNRRVVVQITDANGAPIGGLVEDIKVPVDLASN